MNRRFLIVDDERLSRGYLQDMILEFLPGAEVIQKDSVTAAAQYLQANEVDVLLLDIHMPERNGFSLLREVKSRSFALVFVTAYREYAIQAIRQGAADYLLKPVKKSEFRAMLARMLNRVPETPGEKASYLDGRLSVSHQQGIRVLPLRDIVYLKADNTYTIFHLASGERFTSARPISRFAEQLDASWFVRVHKSFLINMAHFKEYRSCDGAQALMDNGDRLHISRYRLADFLNRIRQA